MNLFKRKVIPYHLVPSKDHKGSKTREIFKYRHDITITFGSDDYVTLFFTSEKKARDCKRSIEECTNNIKVEYTKQELPRMTEEGFIL